MSKSEEKSGTQPQELSFEEALEQLEEIVSKMESGELALDENMSKFEEGMKLAKFCTDKLGETEKKVEILLKSAEGEEEWEEIEQSGSENPEFDFGER